MQRHLFINPNNLWSGSDVLIHVRLKGKLRNLTGATSRTGTAYLRPSPVFSGVRVTWSLVLCTLFCRSLFVLFLLVIVLSVPPRFTDSDFPFGVFKLFLHIWDKMTKWPFYVIKDSRLFWFQAYGPSLTPTPLIALQLMMLTRGWRYLLQWEELEDTKGIVKVVSSECDAYPTVSA